MDAVWVLENVKKDHSFYNRLQLLLLVSSVSLWRKYHKDHNLYFYCDSLTHSVFKQLNILKIWDDVRTFSYSEKINREVFWSAPKTKIISEIETPIVLVDHDFLIFCNIDPYLKDDLLYSYDERSDNWYPSKNDAYNKKLRDPVEFIIPYASNVSLFYLPDVEFAKRYAKQVLTNHEEFTSMNVSTMTSNHMILSEQYMLRQWLEKYNVSHRCLSKNIWDCHKLGFIKNQTTENGIWDLKESLRNYKHYGSEERKIQSREDGYDYEATISFLRRCIKSGGLIDIEELEDNISKNIDE